jgi:thiol-disulfide isomerase/thioredoxin
MKQFLLFSFFAGYIFVNLATAQIVYTDDFESYTVDLGIAEQDDTDTWTTWSETPGSAEDPIITDEAAHQGTQSMVVYGTNDAVLLLNDLTSNRYRVEFYLMVPEGFLGYYNILQDFAGTSSTWGMQAFFKDGVLTIDGNTASAVSYEYTPGEWMKIQHFVDLDNDWIDFYIDGELVHAYQWSHGTFNNGTGINKLDAFNFYAWNDDGAGTPKFYMDDYSIEQVDIPNPPQNFSLQIINDNNVSLSWDAPAEGDPQSYSIIRDGDEIAVVTDEFVYVDSNLYPSEYDYQVKAFYGESVGYSASAGIETANIPGGNERQLVLFEAFTGTWCPQCPTAAQALDMLHNEGLDVAIIEYHGLVNDMYETPATAVRTGFYAPFYSEDGEGFAYPATVIDGRAGFEGALSSVDDQNAYYDYFYEDYIDIPSVYLISPQVERIATSPYQFDVSIDVEETFAYYEDEMRLFVALTETNIPESWQGGLEEINFVLREMYPNAAGSVMDFSDTNSDNYSFQFTLDTSYVIENCELVFFLQNMENAYIMEVAKMDLEDFSAGIYDMNSNYVSVYPNPASEQVLITANEKINEISVHSITGQTVLVLHPGTNQTQILTSAFSSGMYSVKVKTEHNTFVQKLMIN